MVPHSVFEVNHSNALRWRRREQMLPTNALGQERYLTIITEEIGGYHIHCVSRGNGMTQNTANPQREPNWCVATVACLIKG